MHRPKNYFAISDRKHISESVISWMQRRYPELTYDQFIKILGFCRYMLGKDEGREAFDRIKESNK